MVSMGTRLAGCGVKVRLIHSEDQFLQDIRSA
jgi:hypothetical protein